MKKLLLLIVTGALLLSCGSDGARNKIKHVVVIGVDGMTVQGLIDAKTPIMDSLIATGAISHTMRTVLPSSSIPNWSCMIMGSGIEVNGRTSNAWTRDDYDLEPVVKGTEGIFPTMFSVVKENRPTSEIAVIYDWGGFGDLYEKGAVDYDFNPNGAVATAEKTAEIIKASKPILTFVQLDHCDHAGHATGYASAPYLLSVELADSLVGVIVDAVKAAGMQDNTIIIVQADHGGTGNGHGGTTATETTVPFIINGAGVKKGLEIKDQMYVYDVASTAVWALGIEPPYFWTGRPMKFAFEGYPDASTPSVKIVGSLASPTILPKGEGYDYSGGLYIDQPAEIVINSPSADCIVRYTLDGSEPTASSEIYTAPVKVDKTTIVLAKSFDKEGSVSNSTAGYFRVVDSKSGNGLNVSYYKGKNWISVPNFAPLTPLQKWVSPEFKLDIPFGVELIKKNNALCFGLVYDGYINIEKEDTYKFYLQSDDGSMLYIDNKLVVDNNGDHGVTEKSGEIKLSPGKHNIKVEFINAAGGFWLQALIKSSTMPKQVIPANMLYLKK